MAKNAVISNAIRSLMALAIDQEFNTGYLRIYTGSQPADPSVAVGAQVLLAELRFNATAVSGEANGVLTFNALTPENAALATGTATWFRCLKSDGTTAIMDGTVGTADANLVLATTSIVTNAEVAVTAFTVTAAQASAQ
jgi:hypothetical protein